MKSATKYFGFLAVSIEVVGFLLCFFAHHINWSEPISQFGYYPETRFIFGFTLTAASVCIYLFARHLDAYWRHTSILMLLAGIFLSVTGWMPYQPYAKTIIFDLHNAAITLAIVLFSLPMLFMSFKKRHSDIARASQILFFITTVSAIWSVFARLENNGIVYAQIFTILAGQAWTLLTNILLLSHYNQGKLDKETKL